MPWMDQAVVFNHEGKANVLKQVGERLAREFETITIEVVRPKQAGERPKTTGRPAQRLRSRAGKEVTNDDDANN